MPQLATMTPEQMIDFCEIQAEVLNIRYFDGVLKYAVDIHSKVSYKWLAQCHRPDSPLGIKHKQRPVILMNPAMLHATVKEIELVTAHELIHVAQCSLSLKMGHGQDFRDIAKRFGIPSEHSTLCVPLTHIRSVSEMLNGAPPRY